MSTEMNRQTGAYPLLDAFLKRRSRRFGLGMKMEKGPLAFQSRHAPFPLTEEEEAYLSFAASDITGYALLDLSFAEEQGGAIVARSLGRTMASGDEIQTVSLAVINDDATYLIKRPHDFPFGEIATLIDRGPSKGFPRDVPAHASQN